MAEPYEVCAAKFRALAAQVSPGPWQTDEWEIYDRDRVWVGETLVSDALAQSRANAAFIAFARTAVPVLLAEVDRLRRPRWAWPVTLVVWAVAIAGWAQVVWGIANG